MESKELDLRSYNCEVRAEKDESEGAVIVGRPIVYDSKTDLGYFADLVNIPFKTNSFFPKFLQNSKLKRRTLGLLKK